MKVPDVVRKYSKWKNIKGLILDPDKLGPAAVGILIVELVLNVFIIDRVPYTEIDWKAYMQECEGFLNGTLDYSQLRGDTGPLVYPAGFVYFYSLLYYITGRGENIRLAQYVFLVVYLLQLCSVLRIYKKTSKVPPYALALSILTSYRIHSIYVLRLFNDPIAILLLYISLNFFIDSKYTPGSVFFSLAVSVKMNILLFAPSLLLFYLTNLPFVHVLKQLIICASIQFFLGLPFLYGSPVSYIKGSFDVGRVFNHTWTVNYRFLDTDTFENKYFHLTLMFLNLLLLFKFFPIANKYFGYFAKLKYIQSQIQPQIDAENQEIKARNRAAEAKRSKKKPPVKNRKKDDGLSQDQSKFLQSFEESLKKMSAEKVDDDDLEKEHHVDFNKINQLFMLPMFLSNFIGIVCARSLHYQFYSWYFHSLPYLLWCTPYTEILKFLLMALIEFSWNTYPSTSFSSALLHVCHLIILYGVFKNTRQKLEVKTD